MGVEMAPFCTPLFEPNHQKIGEAKLRILSHTKKKASLCQIYVHFEPLEYHIIKQSTKGTKSIS